MLLKRRLQSDIEPTSPQGFQSIRISGQNPQSTVVVVGACGPAGPDGQIHGSCGT